MIRDLRFDEIERADRRRRLIRLVVGCLLLSTAASYLVSREIKIRQDYKSLPEASMGDLESLRQRHKGIQSMLAKHHVWTGAFSARAEVDDLVSSIHDEETKLAKLESKKNEAESRVREEVESARVRAYVFVERREYDLALVQLQRSLELADSLGDDAFKGKAWEHRDKVLLDIRELQDLLAGTDK